MRAALALRTELAADKVDRIFRIQFLIGARTTREAMLRSTIEQQLPVRLGPLNIKRQYDAVILGVDRSPSPSRLRVASARQATADRSMIIPE